MREGKLLGIMVVVFFIFEDRELVSLIAQATGLVCGYFFDYNSYFFN